MHITTVEYRCLKSHGNYNNSTFGAVAEVQSDETPEEAMDKLQHWVEDRAGAMAGMKDSIADLRDEKYRLQCEYSETQIALASAKRKYDKLKDVLAKHGVVIESETLPMDIDDPFAEK